MARSALGLALLLCLLLLAGPVAGQSAAPADGWAEEAMPYLGYTVELPPSWERVVGDTARPVPSVASIADRDPVTARALAAAAEHIAADGGLLDPMGLWAVDPVSLLQLGVLAGEPYRIDADDLRERVETSVAERGSDMGDRVVGPIALPAGGGFRASYLDASDLAQHIEYHLRTPTGRYLVLAASLPGLFDGSLSAVLDGVARSLAPIQGSSGDRPAPASVDTSASAADLLATLPEQVGSVSLRRQLLGGESLVTSSGEASGSLASSLGVLVDAPADLTLAIATPSDSDQDLVVAAYALAGVDKAALDEVLETFPPEVWTHDRLGPMEVLVSVRGDGGRRTWLWSGELANGDAVLYQADSTNGTLAREVVAAIG